MPQHAVTEDMDKVRRVFASLLAWHDARPRATFTTARGWWWATLIAATFFWMSNPLVFVPGFYVALGEALTWTKIVIVISLPWLRIPRVPWPWLLFLVLCLASQIWTVDPVHTDISNRLYIETHCTRGPRRSQLPDRRGLLGDRGRRGRRLGSLALRVHEG